MLLGLGTLEHIEASGRNEVITNSSKHFAAEMQLTPSMTLLPLSFGSYCRREGGYGQCPSIERFSYAAERRSQPWGRKSERRLRAESLTALTPKITLLVVTRSNICWQERSPSSNQCLLGRMTRGASLASWLQGCVNPILP